MGAQVVAEEKVVVPQGAAGRHQVDVDRRRRDATSQAVPARHAGLAEVLEPPGDEQRSGLLAPLRFDGDGVVQDRFGGQAGHRGATDVLHVPDETAQRLT